MQTFLKLAGIALIVLCFIGPIAYYDAKTQNYVEQTKRHCIDAKGEWTTWYGGYCTMPKAKELRNASPH